MGDVKNKVIETGFGPAGSKGVGNFGAEGVAAYHQPGKILILNKADEAADILGDGPLRDLVVSALSITETTVYVVTQVGTIDGSVSTPKNGAENLGVGTVTMTGKPRNEYDITVEILSDGGLNDATFCYTFDGVRSKEKTVPEEGSLQIYETGLTVNFSPGTPTGEEISFKAGDLFYFTTTAPEATNQEYLDAISLLLDSAYHMEFIAVAEKQPPRYGPPEPLSLNQPFPASSIYLLFFRPDNLPLAKPWTNG